ncbi:transposase [uncultured Oscillibacter sp.]|uniref:transposase n=1 Tax=uncultured Oscillibacter sp. TaxID=876091 RepID=UPI0035A722B8
MCWFCPGNIPFLQQRYGQRPIDPVVLVKYLLTSFLYGIPSERQIEWRIHPDVVLR